MARAWISGVATVFAAVLGLSTAAFAQEFLRIGGTGMGLALTESIGEALNAADPAVAVTVLPSLGTPGGIKALASGAIDVAIAARSMTESERATGIREAACLKTALVFATSRHDAPGLASATLPDLYLRQDPRWPDGQAMRLILRSPAGSENDYVIRLMPRMQEAFEAAYRRPEIPVGATDQENAALAEQISGSLSILTLLQIRAERLRLTTLALDGVTPSLDTIESGRYPMPLQVCFLLPPTPKPGATKFVSFIRSPAGREIVGRHDSTLED